MHILTGNLIRDLPTNRVNGLSAQVWRSCSETGPIIHLGSKVGRGETLKKPSQPGQNDLKLKLCYQNHIS